MRLAERDVFLPFENMKTLKVLSRSLSLFAVTLSIGVSIPGSAVAADSVDSLLQGADSKVISRGDFLRAAVKITGVTYDETTKASLPFPRVPDALNAFVTAGLRENALGAFGPNLYLSRTVTRGEAVRVVVELLDVKSLKSVSFRDVTRGTSLDKAVRVAIEHEWLTPMRGNFFGSDRPLTVGEAKTMLRKATDSFGKSGASIRVNTDTKQVARIRLSTSDDSSSQGLPKEDIMQSVWSLLNNEYLYQEKVDRDEAAYAAIEAIVDSMDDPYTKFLRPASAASFQTQIKGEISGIGAQVEEIDGFVTVVTPLTGSPAEAAGVKPGDRVIAADGESLVGLSFSDAVDKIRGPRGSIVELTIRRDAGEVKIRVKRDIIRIPEISIKWQSEIAVVRLMQFGRLTESDLRDEMKEVQAKKPRGIILDVRNNPGGLLTAADVVLSNFLPRGSDVAIIKSKEDERVEKTPYEPTIDDDVPVIVLVNGGSASASEIVAAALRDHKRARILGEKTFGKGTVQAVLQMKDGSNLKMTTAEWLSPKGAKIDGVGVTPDIEVKYSNDRDQQLLKAVELLR